MRFRTGLARWESARVAAPSVTAKRHTKISCELLMRDVSPILGGIWEPRIIRFLPSDSSQKEVPRSGLFCAGPLRMIFLGGGSHVHRLGNPERICFIMVNPVRRGLVERPEDGADRATAMLCSTQPRCEVARFRLITRVCRSNIVAEAKKGPRSEQP